MERRRFGKKLPRISITIGQISVDSVFAHFFSFSSPRFLIIHQYEIYRKVALQLGCNGVRGEDREKEENFPGMWYAESVLYLTG